MAFVSFVENNKSEIYKASMTSGSISLERIVKASYPLKGEYLCEYINARKKKFESSFAEGDEYIQFNNINEKCKGIPTI